MFCCWLWIELSQKLQFKIDKNILKNERLLPMTIQMILYVKENQVYAKFFQNFLKIALSICKNNFNCLNCFHLVFF